MNLFLLMFTVCYLGRRTRRTDLALVLGLLLTVVFSVPLFRHQLVFNPRLDAIPVNEILGQLHLRA
jgi:hypothetical protein